VKDYWIKDKRKSKKCTPSLLDNNKDEK